MFLFILILILFLVFFVPTLVLSIIARVLSFFRFGARNRHTHTNREHHEARYTHTEPPKNKNRKKIFDKNEGEYVDFEEIE
ncbi:MAG: DUF4834 family protein [Bacteroidaceae bacterium]|nr:DUF4834 family protein [Bacteroidaceae bacterium]